MKHLNPIILNCTKPKVRDEVITIRKQKKNFNFVFMLVVQCKDFTDRQYSSKVMWLQCKLFDLISSHKRLQVVLKTLLNLEGVVTVSWFYY